MKPDELTLLRLIQQRPDGVTVRDVVGQGMV